MATARFSVAACGDRPEPARVALHDDRPAQQRKAEQLRGAHLGVDRRRVVGDEVAERAVLRLLDAGQRDGRQRGGGDPG